MATTAPAMRALVSSPEGPTLAERPRPTPGPNQVLVRVHAAPLNRADLAMLRGAAHGAVGGMGSPLGLEWAGEIAGQITGARSVVIAGAGHCPQIEQPAALTAVLLEFLKEV